MVGSGIGDPKTETLGADTYTSNNAEMKTAIAGSEKGQAIAEYLGFVSVR